MPKINEEVLKILEEKEKEAEHFEKIENPDFKEYDDIEIDEKENKIFRHIINSHEIMRFREMIEIYEIQKGGKK